VGLNENLSAPVTHEGRSVETLLEIHVRNHRYGSFKLQASGFRLSVLPLSLSFSPPRLCDKMAFRLGRRVLSQFARPSLRTNGQNAGRRSMSSSAHGAETSDKPWIIGSALVFGPAAVYLLSPSSKAKAHNAQQHSLPKTVPTPTTPLPIKDDEGTEVPAQEVESSVQAAVEEDSPKDAQSSEEKEAKEDSSEGEAAPATDATPEESKPEPASEEPAPAEAEKPAEDAKDAPAADREERKDAKDSKAEAH